MQNAQNPVHSASASIGSEAQVATADTRPAAPALPLKISGTGYLVDRNGLLCGEPNISYDAYIVHAANAYPKLVDALKADMFALKRTYGEIEDVSRVDGMALLRELGEL